MASFIFGGNTGVSSPQELQERRDFVRAMQARAVGQVPQDPWQGLNAIAAALGGRIQQGRLDKAESEGRAGATSKFDALFNGSPQATVTPVSYSPEEQTGAPGYRGIAKVMPQSDTGKWLNTQLASDPDLKLSPAAAAGITGNLDLETGGFKHMQEIKPMVPGSRGGYGWAQWTGPRRVQFEAWAKQNGLDPASKEANFGFLKHEMLNTPEGKVLGSLQGAQDPGQAATVFSDQYLRPGIPHMDRRVAAAQGYAGGAPSIQPAGDTQPVRLAQASGPTLSDMLRAYSDPWASPEQKSILQMHIEQEMQKADPLRQQQLEKGGLEIEALKNPKAEYGFTTLPDGTVLRTDKTQGTAEPVMKGQQKATDDEQELATMNVQREKAGLPPLRLDEWLTAKSRAGATSINMGEGDPADGELRKKLQGKEAESWSGYQAGAEKAAGMSQQMEVLDELGKMAPQGAIQGRAAQWFPGFSTAGDAFTSITTRIAPSFREPGSGSTSDIEYQGFLNSLPRLQTSPGGNAIISATIRSMANIKMERGAIVDAYADGTITAPEARKRMRELNKRSIMTPELQAIINANTKEDGGDIGKPPEGVTPQEWQHMSPEDRALWK